MFSFRKQAHPMRALAVPVLALSLMVSGCGSWQPVIYQPQPAGIADPVAEVTTLLNLRLVPAVKIEVTDQIIKEIFAFGGGTGLTTRVLPLSSATFRIISRGTVYQVSAYDPGGREIWAYRPSGEDLPTCQKMTNALYALAKRQP
jgi:hypothetical protein